VRVALVHDFLTQRGGAERVVLHLARTLADPVIVTALYAPEQTYPEFRALEVMAHRWVDGNDARHFRRHVLAYPKQFASFDLSDFDLAIISSSAFAHHVRHPLSAVYWHTPPRFLYDPGAYLHSTFAGRVASLPLWSLRRGDRRAATAHQLHSANSLRTAARLRRCYGIEATVIHPPFDGSHLGALTNPPASPRALVVSRLLPYKRVDVAIAACESLGLPLTVVGDGPERVRLQSMASSSTTFRGVLSDAALAEAYATHSLVICPGSEDFGFVPLEAGYAGRPVIASMRGGASETVVSGRTGLLVDGWDVDDWAAAIAWVLEHQWHPGDLRTCTSQFDAAHFDAAARKWLEPLEIAAAERGGHIRARLVQAGAWEGGPRAPHASPLAH